MIVACPSCQRRYRHEFFVTDEPPTARCSGCDERFPLDRPKRRYRLVRPPAAPAPECPQRAIADELQQGIEMPIGAPVAIDTLVEPAPESVAAEAPADRIGGAARAVSGLRSFGESLVALVPSGVGAAVAYHYSVPLGQDPITWGALGGAVGLLLGWACLLWITRGD